MYSTYVTVYVAAAKGRQTRIQSLLLVIFALFAITVTFPICCDLRLLYDTSKDNKKKNK